MNNALPQASEEFLIFQAAKFPEYSLLIKA